MSVSSGSDVTIPMQDSPPPPPSPYANQKLGNKPDTPEPRAEMVTVSGSGVENAGYQAEATCLNNGQKLLVPGEKKRTQTEIPMSDYSGAPPSGPHLNEAVNSELVNMNVLDTIPHKPQSEFGPYENFDDYFISVNQHKKFLRRGEKLYVTKDKRKSSTWKKYVCWLAVAVVLAALLTGAVLAAVGLIPYKTESGSYSMVGMTTTTGFPNDESSSWTEAGDLSISSSSTPPSITDDAQSSSSTEFVVPASDIYVPYAAELQLILDSDYDSELGNSNSTQFQALASTVQEEVKDLLRTDGNVGIAYARVTSFSSGSIIAKLRIGWTDADETKEYTEIQRVVSRWKQIGTYQLRPGTTLLYHLYNFCKVSNGGCSDFCAFEYEILDFVCTCPESKLLSEDKKTCQEMPLPSPPTPQETSSESDLDLNPTVPASSEEPADSDPGTNEPPASSTEVPEILLPITSTSTSTTTNTTTTTTEAPTTTSTTTTTTTEAPTTTTTTVAPEPPAVDVSSESSSDETSRSLEPVDPTVIPEVEPEVSSTSIPHPPVEEDANPIQVYPHPEIDQPLPATPATTTTTTTEIPVVRALEQDSHETIPIPVETNVEPEIPVETTTTPSPIITPIEVEVPASVTTTTTTTTTTTEAPVVVHQHESRSEEDISAANHQSSYEDGAVNSQSLESETIVAATTTAATTTTSSTTTTTAPVIVHQGNSEEQVDSRSIEAESEEVLPAQPIVTNLTSQSRVKTGRAETSAFLGDSSMERETDAPPTTRPLVIPSRPQSHSDEFMAYSDANMKELNARFTDKTTTSTTSPATQHDEVGSYENSSGGAEFEITSGSHSEESAGSGEEKRNGALLLSPPEVIPINSIGNNVNLTTTTPAASRERETLESSEDRDPIGASQEQQETTTFLPISLHNDTAVNDLTPGITEDPINTEPVESNQNPDVVVEEVADNPEKSSIVQEVEVTTVKPIPTPAPAPVPIIQEIPAVPAESDEGSVPKSEETSVEHEPEPEVVVPITTTTTTTPAAPVQVPAVSPAINSTETRPGSEEVMSIAQDSSQEIPQDVHVHPNTEPKSESHDRAEKDNENELS